ncbi:MAG: hypothetical protein ACFCU8_03310 [Thermosynechococcaceae cyanobacterium]
MAKPNRYSQIIDFIFHRYYQDRTSRVDFNREDIIAAARELELGA